MTSSNRASRPYANFLAATSTCVQFLQLQCKMALSASTSNNGQKPARSRFKLALPALVTSHLNAHDLKIFFRCWVAVWVAFLLVFIQPSLEEFGQATFFAALVLVIAPP